MKKKIAFFVLLIVIAAATAFGAVYYFRKEKTQTASTTQETTQTQTEAATAAADTTHPGQSRSILTGEWISQESTSKVPIAVMYNNIKEAMPQSSISYADVLLESKVEGGITRLCALFTDTAQTEQLSKIGPVRSCRTYYLLFAKEFEAIYVHFGYSEYAAAYLAKPEMHALDGMTEECNFYRTDDRPAPHNAYTDWSSILAGAAQKNYPTTYPAGFTAPFRFNTDDASSVTMAGATPCTYFAPGYTYNNPYFTYDAASREYLRYQFDAAHIDAENNKQLSFKNILVKYVEPAYYDNDTPDYTVAGTGKGLYISEGQAVEVTWKKETEEQGPTRFYLSDGTELTMNQGKTYYALVETTQAVTVNP